MNKKKQKKRLSKEQRERLADARRKRLAEEQKKNFVSEEEKKRIREEKKKRANEATVKIINNTPGISFVEFKNIDELRDRMPPPVGNTFQPWEELGSTQQRDDVVVSAWIIEMLKSENITGTMIFMYEDQNEHWFPDFAEVILSDSYEWVVPLWKRGHGLSMYSFERGYSWIVFSFDDRRAFLRINLKND